METDPGPCYHRKSLSLDPWSYCDQAYVEVCGLCYHQWPGRSLWSVLQPEGRLTFMGHSVGGHTDLSDLQLPYEAIMMPWAM